MPNMPVDIEMKMAAKAAELLALNRELLAAHPIPEGMDMEASIRGGAIQSIIVHLSNEGIVDGELANLLGDVVGMFCAETFAPREVFDAIITRAFAQMIMAINEGVVAQPRAGSTSH